MGRMLLVLVLAGCAHSSSSGPAWPKERVGTGDGGQSIAPREAATSVAVAMDNDDDDKPTETPVDKPDAPAAAPSSEAGAPATNAAAPTEEPITTEEIVIEVGPDD